jgi:LuxR family maltose regulon positive regulatory protein
MQQVPLLQSKLYVPPIRPELVSRPRLIERLNEGLSSPSEGHSPRTLTLISAPAGYGKTTLLSEWTHKVGGQPTHSHAPAPSQVVWLSLDEGDSELTRFLTYLVAALQTIAPRQSPAGKIGERVLALLQAPQPPPTETILTALLDEIATISDNFVLVLDDFHAIDAQPIDEALTFLLEHLPPQMHLVIVTREDPNLPLARLRVRGQLTEVRVTDLRFTPAEAAAFLNQVMSLNLSAEEIAALETRTEGWIAGLQLAALSMRGREDVSGFIKAFAGDNRYIVDYLVEEVLHRQPERVRSFLLQTSILQRLCGPLCDAVRFDGAKSPSTPKGDAVCFAKSETRSRPEGGRAILESLERGNLFVVPLDDKRQWYRYHHLFAEVLHAHLMEELPHQVPTLHRRASQWYEQNGLPADAIRHALTAGDFERAAGLVELVWPAMDRSFQSATWLGWVQALPAELIRARPVLSVDYAWALLDSGELEVGEARLRDAERWLDTTPDASERWEAPPAETSPEQSQRLVVVDEEQFRKLPASIASARAYLAQAFGDVPASVKHARRALDFLPADDHFERGRLAVLLGLAHWASGDLDTAHHSFADAMASFQMAGNILFAVSFTFILADIRIAQGRLQQALSTYEQSLQLAREQGAPIFPGMDDLYRGIGELYRERGDLEAARQNLQRSEELSDQSEVYQSRLCVAQARMKEARSDLDGALKLLDEAERQADYRNPLPDLRPIGALKARIWIAQGRLAEALAWVRQRGLSADDELSYLREFEHMTLARVLIARYRRDRLQGTMHKAMGLLERLLKAAEEGGRMGSAIEILVLQALAHQAQGDVPRALAPLERALTLAEPEGYFRIFVDEGPPMATLLREAAKHSAAPNYVTQLWAAFGKAEGTVPVTQLLIEPLSERELEVLRLLRTELNGPEIARELVVSLNTMRTHTKNIYSKLGVNNRRAAVRRAEELDLV